MTQTVFSDLFDCGSDMIGTNFWCTEDETQSLCRALSGCFAMQSVEATALAM